MLPCQGNKGRRNPEEKTKAVPSKTVHRYPRDLTRNWTALTARRLSRHLHGACVMTDKSNKPEIEFRSEFRDNRGPREPSVYDQIQDDDDYFTVPEVMDEP
jgi:hypothetical protein